MMGFHGFFCSLSLEQISSFFLLSLFFDIIEHFELKISYLFAPQISKFYVHTHTAKKESEMILLNHATNSHHTANHLTIIDVFYGRAKNFQSNNNNNNQLHGLALLLLCSLLLHHLFNIITVVVIVIIILLFILSVKVRPADHRYYFFFIFIIIGKY